MPRVVLYIAASLDGYIADADGGVGWLEGFDEAMGGYEEFFASVGSLVMGRATYDFASGYTWPYGSKPTAVYTHRPISAAPDGVFATTDHPAGLVARLRGMADGDTWLVGGSQVVARFQDAGCIDEYRVFVIPRLLGRGVRLFARREPAATRLDLVGLTAHAGGVAESVYRPPGRAASRP